LKGNVTVLVVNIGHPAKLLCYNPAQLLIDCCVLVVGDDRGNNDDMHYRDKDDDDDMSGLVHVEIPTDEDSKDDENDMPSSVPQEIIMMIMYFSLILFHFIYIITTYLFITPTKSQIPCIPMDGDYCHHHHPTLQRYYHHE